jgi:Uma2 family endonuclease
MTAALSLPERREWTVDDLSELPADLPYELINGRLVVPSPTPAHQDLGGEVWLAVRANCPPEYVVSMDQSLMVNSRNEPRPDVVAVRVEHYGRTPVPIEDAVLAIEILSEHSHWRDTVEKAVLYAKAGIATYWVIDQLGEDGISLTELVLEPERAAYRINGVTTSVVTVTEPWPITLDLPALTARRAAILERIQKAEESSSPES